MGGWIKINRSMIDHWIWKDADALRLWLEMLIRANFEDKTRLFNGQLIHLKRGQLVFGRKVYADRLGMNENTIRKVLKLLISDGMIHQQTTNKYSIITITCYDKYQDSTSNSPATHQQPTNNAPHLKNYKNEKKEKKVVKRFVPPTADEVTAYCKSRANGIDGERFVDWYAARGWKVGRDTMKDWKAAIRTWERRHKQENQSDDNWEVSR